MPEVTVTYSHYEAKKGSVRMRTEERLGQQYDLPDVYIPRAVLASLGLNERQQNSPDLKIDVSYTISKEAK